MQFSVFPIIKTLLVSSICFLVISCSCSNTAGIKGNGDLIAPEVESISPAKFKTKVPLNSFVSATFSELMDISTIQSKTVYLKDANNKLISAELYAKEKSVTLKPTSPLDRFMRYTVTLERGIRDNNGNRLIQDFQWIFTTGNEFDRTPPEVDNVIPTENETAVNIDTQVTVSFSELIDISSLSTDSFRLEDSTGNLVSGSFDLSGRQLLFTPDMPLSYGTKYLLTLTTEIQDLAANTLQSNYISSFTTADAPDATGPFIVNVYPGNNTTNIPTNSSIAVTFSESLSDASADTDNFLVTHSNGQVVSGSIALKDNILIFTPNIELLTSTEYLIVLKQTISDLTGNTMLEDFTWRFTTGDGADTTPPSISYVQPEINATNVANNNSITVTFSETIDPKTLGLTKFTVVANGDYVSGTVTYSGTTVIFKPKNTLANSSLHEVSIAAGVSDLSGNLTTETYSWKFTTGTARDSDIPRVSSVYPVNGATDFAVNSAIIVRFTEAMNPATLTPKSIYLQDEDNNIIESTVVTTGASSSLRPLEKLEFSKQYSVYVTTEVADLAENTLAENFSWSFTTATEEDTLSPSIISTTPSSGSQKAAVNRGIIITFSEAISAETISTDNFFLTDTSGNLIPGTISTTEDTAIYKPLKNLDYTKSYTTTVLNTMTDMAGNPLNKTYTWNFTTSSQPDETAPTVLYSAPAENGLVAVNQNIIVQFSEAMNTSSINNATIKLTDLNGNFINTIVNAAEQNALIRSQNDLEFDTNYRITITTGVKDLADNNMAANFVVNFKTSLHPDLAPPFVVSSNPYDLEQNVHVTATPTLLFSEALNCLAINDGDFQLLQNSTPVSGSINCSGDTLTFQPDEVLKTQSDFTLVASTAIADLSADTLQTQYQSTFQTAAWTQQTGTVFSEQAFSVVNDASDNIITSGFTTGSFGDLNKGSSDIFITKHDKNSTLLWTKQYGSSGDDYVTGSTTDASGNIYITGYTYGDFAATSIGNADIFVIKLDTLGNLVWQKQFGTSDDDAANAITLDSNNNIILAAYSFSNFDGNTSSGQHDIVIVKLDNDGNIVWSQQYGSIENDIPNSIALDNLNNIYLTGYTLGSLQSNTHQGDADVFISQLASDGTHQWTTTIGSPLTDIAQSIALDSLGNILISGFTLGELNAETNKGSSDHFVAKYDNTGTLTWLKQFGTTLDDRAYSVAANSDDTIVVSGYTSGDMQGTNSGKFDTVAYQLDASGNLNWITQIGSSEDDVSFAMSLDSNENIYISGYTAGNLDNLEKLGQQDIFILKLNASGEKQ